MRHGIKIQFNSYPQKFNFLLISDGEENAAVMKTSNAELAK